MKYMTIEHMEKLDALKLNKYFIDCAFKLEKIAYENAFEENVENYERFVKHVYAVAKKHNINDKQHIFSLMLLWHVEGDVLTKDEQFLDILSSTTMHNHEKAKYFKDRAINSMRKERL